MKQVCIYVAFLMTANFAFGQGGNGNENAQNAQRWRVNGNETNETHFIGTTNEAPLNFRTNNENRLYITPDGRIGMGGITNPLARLQVEGDLKLSGDITFDKYADINDTIDKVLFVDKDGKTTTKSLKSIKDFMYSPYICNEAVDMEGNMTSPNWQNGLNKIYTGCPLVNVGINNINPRFKLDVRGNIRGSKNLFIGVNVATKEEQFDPASRIHVINPGGNKGDFIRFDEFQLGKGLTTVFKVDLNGFVTARDVKVTLNEIPDFVFKEDYNLPSLKDQASFITTNGHLLRMPSEAQMQNEDVGLGKIAMANLQISEEQMLYLIEMDEQLETLTEENEALKEKVERLEQLMEKLLNEEK